MTRSPPRPVPRDPPAPRSPAWTSGATAWRPQGGDQPDDAGERGPGANRHLFITADFDTEALPEPTPPADTAFQQKAEGEWSESDRRSKELFDAHEDWATKVEEGRAKAEELNRRFAGWYYVIAAEDFEKLRVTRKDLVQAKTS